jgi:hypothetical protein
MAKPAVLDNVTETVELYVDGEGVKAGGGAVGRLML